MFNLDYLTFSDAAKFADLARNIISHNQYTSNFEFFGGPPVILPFTPYLIALFFWLFGIKDVSVVFMSLFFLFVTLIFIYLLSNKLFKSSLIAFLSVISVGFNPQILNYATNGSSEMPFIFQLIAGTYFFSQRTKIYNLLGFLTLFLMYITRPQAIVYIFGLTLFYFINNFKVGKALLYTLLFFAIGTTVYMVFLRQGLVSVSQNLPGIAVSESLRGGVPEFSWIILFKKVFYNIYNFYKALPEIINPYLFGLFLIGIFNSSEKKLENNFKFYSLFVVLSTLLVTALTIPFYRYIHPIIPFVYITASATLVQVLNSFKSRIWTTVLSCFLVLFFCVGQTLGMLFLDSRFNKKIQNIDKPPIYVQMSYKLKEITNLDQTILTNLDTWGSWYGERKTIWFPLEPSMILEHQEKIDAIYLTSYKIDDENYYMGENWREIFKNPENQKILEDYKFVGSYNFKAEDNYDNENGSAVLFVKK